MDPLHKIDSAISVASKDNGIYVEGQQPAEGPPPPTSHPEPSRHTDQLNDDQHLHSLPSTKLQEEKEPQATTESTSSRQEPAPAAHLLVSPTPQAATQSAAMENLIAPRDTANRSRSPRPDYIDQPSADWYQLQLRPPTPPTYAVDTGDSSSASTAPSPFVFTAGGNSGGESSTSATESAAEDEGGEREEEHDHGADALTQAGTGAIDVDHDQLELESDPGYESDRASFASTSLSSSVRDYLFENGRRYHRFREGRYNFPNDEAEQDREDMKHACVKMLCQNQLYFAPFDENNLQNVLDIGTGTGIWAIEFGDLFPSADVLGIDLSPIQPDWVPANVHFVVDDAESDWIYPPDHFDYIHTRHTVMAIKDWPKLYREAKE